HRGIEWNLQPWLRSHCIPIMAYSPLDEGRLLDDPRLLAFANSAGMTPAQLAIAWLMSREGVIAIPKTSEPERLLENMEALERPLDKEELSELDRLFPSPQSPQPLEMR
ncbi:MAG: aldo/keto reductase, partial [Rhodomicrobium sp.]